MDFYATAMRVKSFDLDSTIDAMLRMIDSIHSYYNKCAGIKLFDALNRIQFYVLNLDDFGLSEELYIKMNARGLPLTPFENFKADLAGYIRKKKEVEEKNPLSEQHPWLDLDNEEQGLAIAIDTDWMNVFWEHRSNDYALDEIYFAFLNRYFFNAYALQLNNVAQLLQAQNLCLL